jgi:carbonic anhydrase
MKRFLFQSFIEQDLEEFSIKTSSFLAIALMLSVLTTIAWASEEKSEITGEQSLQMLMEGNARYISGNASHPDQSAERRSELTAGQHPFAIIVGCSDSRVPPELIFDQGLGDIFVIRTAGQVLDDVAIASIEYGVEHLSAPLVVVLGHDSCGAVTAAVTGGEPEGHLGSLVNFIELAVEQAKEMGNESELLDNSIDNNVYNIVDEMKASQPILSEKVEKGELLIVGARYHLQSGAVEFFE